MGDAVKLFFGRKKRKPINQHYVASYERLVAAKLRANPDNRSLALAQAIGAPTMENFAALGDGHVAVLRHHGLIDGMSVYDLGCGCGRTAQALQRSGWTGTYMGADIVKALVDELKLQCPTYSAEVHRQFTILAPDNSVDMLFHWSVFTHLYPEESFLYMRDSFRALKPGGRMVFSFLELEDPDHHSVFRSRTAERARDIVPEHLDAFLHRDWVRFFAKEIGFTEPRFTSGSDGSNHPPFWQALAIMDKPSE
jgi:2-polyprenyl-3-methyl-5-hydroxy-6-metoxy-1,4-benzoquinol methylase